MCIYSSQNDRYLYIDIIHYTLIDTLTHHHVVLVLGEEQPVPVHLLDTNASCLQLVQLAVTRSLIVHHMTYN